MAWGHGSTRERQPTFLEIQIAVGVDPVSDRTRSARIDSTARLSGSPSQWTEPGPHAVTRHLHGTTLPPRAWDHLVPHSCRPTGCCLTGVAVSTVGLLPLAVGLAFDDQLVGRALLDQSAPVFDRRSLASSISVYAPGGKVTETSSGTI